MIEASFVGGMIIVIRRSRHFTYILAAMVVVVSMGFLSEQSAADSSSVSLKPTTTQDGTATIGIPPNWSLEKGANGFVSVRGPNDERINLGVIVVAKNASIGTTVGGEVAFAMPFSASLRDKLTTIIQAGAKKQGMAMPQISFAGQSQTKLPMCSLFLGGWTSPDQPSRKFEAVLCSLQPDTLGLYKNLVFLAQVPSNLAAQDRPLVMKIVQSYRVTPNMFKKMVAPYTPLPPRPSGGYAASIPGFAPYEDPTNSDCFDYNIIRESPPWEMPMHCGGWQPG